MNMRRNSLAGYLRLTAERLRDGAAYKWTHQGRCNCGHLIQTLTGLEGRKIHEIAVLAEGEWADHISDYCDTSGLPVDELIREMLAFGLSLDELGDLERLAAPKILRWLPHTQRYLNYRNREDVILYFETWAKVIDAEEQLRRSPGAEILINGKRFFMHETPTAIPLALDENPAAGRVA